MIFNNLSDKVLLLFNEPNYVGASYIIEELLFNGCPSGKIVASGTLENLELYLVLKDGKYQITVVKDNLVDLKEKFFVYYNSLPDIILKLKQVLCPCQDCKKQDNNIFLTFFYFLGFMQSLDLLCNNSLFAENLNRYYTILKEKDEYKKYYGTFKFDIEKVLKNLLVEAYVELYLTSYQSLKDNEEILSDIDSVFESDLFEQCLYKQGYSFQNIACKIKNLKCNCDE